MRIMILSLFFLVLNAQASTLSLYCSDKDSLEACALKTEAALEKLGCVLDKSSTDCTYARKADPQNQDSTIPTETPYCSLTSQNCSDPMQGNFGGESCFDREKVRISRADGVHQGYWFLPWSSYSRTICRAR